MHDKILWASFGIGIFIGVKRGYEAGKRLLQEDFESSDKIIIDAEIVDDLEENDDNCDKLLGSGQ